MNFIYFYFLLCIDHAISYFCFFFFFFFNDTATTEIYTLSLHDALPIYDLGSPKGWISLLVDMTWSAPNTVWGFVVGNLIFWFVGSPSRADSADQGWIVFKPYSSSGFGHGVLQTHGTVNLGGPGQHEKMHLLQARIFG